MKMFHPNKQVNELANQYSTVWGEKETNDCVSALLYSFGVDEFLEMLRKAKNRRIDVEYGEGCDNLTRVYCINEDGTETDLFRAESEPI